MINLEKEKISELFKKQYNFIEKDKWFVLKKETDKYFYSGVDYIRDKDELVVSIGYDLRENYLSESIWIMRDKRNWEWMNDEKATRLEFFLHKNNQMSEFPQLPSLEDINRQSLEKVIKKRSVLFKENFDSLIRELLLNVKS